MAAIPTQPGPGELIASIKERPSARPREPWLQSFPAKLYAGFAGIALLTLFATGFALYLFNKFGQVVNKTAGEAIPELMAVMRLSESSALLAAVAPVLAAASGETDLREAESRIDQLVEQIGSSNEMLGSARRDGSLGAIQSQSEALLATIAELKEATQRRLSLEQSRLANLAELRDVQGGLTDILNPVVYGVTSLSNLLARRGGRMNAAALEDLIEVRAEGLTALLDSQSALYRIAALVQSRRGDSAVGADGARRRDCLEAQAALEANTRRLERLELGSELEELLVELRAVGGARICEGLDLESRSPRQRAQVELLGSAIGRLDPNVSEFRRQLESSYVETVQRIKGTPQRLASGAIRDFQSALDLKAEANLLIALLTSVTYADDRHTVTNLFNRYRGSLVALGNAVDVFERSELAVRNPVLAGQVLELEQRLAAFSQGETTLFYTRWEQLAIAERIRTLLETHREQSNLLTGDAGKLVETVEADVSSLRRNMERQQLTAVSILVAVWCGSLTIAALIAYFTTRLLSRHEADLRAAKNTSELINQELEAFNYSVSHDLRAPLRTLSGFSQALLEDYSEKLDRSGKEYLQYLQDGSREMGELIDGLLRLSRSTRGEVSIEELDLSEMAQGVLANLHGGDPQRQVRFRVEPGLRDRADPRLLKVVLENLFGNAWKYTAKTPQALIAFEATVEAGTKVYCVRDNGAGFDMAYAELLFQPFQRLHRTEEFEGTGIGLATVQRIIRRHGGCIWAEAKPGQGACFFFTLQPYESET